MIPAPLPDDEAARLAALRELLVLDSSPEPVFDGIARMAAEICGTPIALLSLVDAERQWFKANVGLHGVTETPRDVAFCAHAILGESVFEVPDAADDGRFAGNPLVTAGPGIRFYAGSPLMLPGGGRVGTLCVIDRQARRLTDDQMRLLKSLAAVASDALSMRRDLVRKTLAARSRYERALSLSASHYRAIVEDQIELISLARIDGTLTYVNPAYARHFGRAAADMVGHSLYEFIEPADRDAVAMRLAGVVRSGQAVSSENRMLAADETEHWVAWTNGLQRDATGEVLLHSVGRDISARRRAEDALRASQSFLSRTGRVAGVGGWEVDLASRQLIWSDETRRIHEVGPAYEPTVDDAIGFYEPEARPQIRGAVERALADGQPWDLELPLVTAAGRRIWVRAVGAVEHAADGRPLRLTGALQDVTARKQLEQQVAAEKATLELIAESIPATVAVVDRRGRYVFVNSAFAQACGHPRERIIGRGAREVLGEPEFERRWPFVQRALAGEAVSFELDHPAADGTRHVALSYVPLRLASGEVDRFVVVTQDVTQQKREALRLLELSQRDPLTGLLNRAGFETHLERRLKDGDGPSLGLLYVDLDGFKSVNDRHGHAAGDQVLKAFAARLGSLVRPSDAVARLGGDEFAVALAGLPAPSVAGVIADKIVAAARQPFDIDGRTVRIGASVGIAFGADRDSGWTELVDRADAKLLSAKASGKGRHLGATS